MQIHVLGAAGEVTGSAYLVRSGGANVLIDFGVFQGGRDAERKNRVPRELPVKQLDAVVLTHAHLDHTGRLPLLAKARYQGPIFATPATVSVTHLILRDAAHLQESDAARESRQRRRQGRPPVLPLFSADDVARLQPLFRPAPYNEPYDVAPGVRVRMVEAGHMLGATSIELTATEDGRERVIAFSGDVGPTQAPPLRPPASLDRAELVFLESTYGDRDHQPLEETLREFREIIVAAVGRKAKILIPVFAVGRAQLILYHLATLFREGAVPPFPVYLDSPMAIEATRLYEDHAELYDEASRTLIETGRMAQDLRTLRTCPSADDSRALNETPGPCLILAGSGMCNGGRILHHLKHNLWRPEAAVIFVGYQGVGTLGRALVDGHRRVKVLGVPIAVRASLHTLGGFSAHAGQTDLLDWLSHLVPARPRVVLTHGEERGRQPLGQLIAERFGLTVEYPMLGDVVTL